MGRHSHSRRSRRRRDSYDEESDDSLERRRWRNPRRSPSREYRRSRKPPIPRRRLSPDKPYRFDSPPKDQDNVMNAMAAAKAVGGGLADAQNIMQSIQTMSMAQAAKVDRKLYVGNLPPDIKPKELVDYVNHALQKVSTQFSSPDPVLSAWISSDGHYAFIEFKNPEEANQGFALNNISIHGYSLKVGRPNTYNGVFSSMNLLKSSALMMGDSMLNPEKHAQNVLDAEEELFDPLGEKKMIKEEEEVKKPPKIEEPKIEEEGNVKEKEFTPVLTKMGVLNVTTGGKMNPIMGGTVNSMVYKIELPSKILVLKDIIQYEYVAYEDDFEDLVSDIKKEMTKYGMVVNIKIPHYKFLLRKEEDEEKKVLEEGDIDLKVIKANLPPKVGFGNAYVEFVSMEEAKAARKELIGRKYGENFVDVWYHNEEKFANDDFSLPGIITTGKENMGEFEGMQHLAIEFKDGGQSSVQEELRNLRQSQRDYMNQLAITDQPNIPKEVKVAEAYRVGEEMDKDPIVKEE